ncbi:hypothetical protein NTJ12_002556, partial [Flavobacterium psychrophilum]|nr:hypothetical protein [Flavobacterium psychrophilum]
MAINKTAKNMYINIKGTHTVIAKEIVITAEKVSIIATKGDLTLISNKKVIIKGKDGVKFGDYVAPTEEKHPEIVEVQFLDENNKVLKQETLAEFGNIQATNFAIGKKIKIKIITKDVIDLTKISFDLKAETKSPNQKFFGLDKQKWNLEIKGNTCETPFFEFDNLWFSEDFEKYNYTSHLNEITSDDLNSFYVKGTLNAKPFELPNKTDRLKPVTYLRNYEELIGLFHTNNTKTKDLVDNFENKYIAGSMFENITRDFSEFINHTQNLTISQIKTRVEQDAKLLWETAIKQVQSGNLDDRPLYWARIKMQVRLKQHYLFEKDIDFKTSTINVGSELEKIIQLFEINSRNYTGIDFSKTPVGKKKLLISGYDPFVMNPEKSGNPRQSNPSGVTA